MYSSVTMIDPKRYDFDASVLWFTHGQGWVDCDNIYTPNAGDVVLFASKYGISPDAMFRRLLTSQGASSRLYDLFTDFCLEVN
jgi:hypothetical protein